MCGEGSDWEEMWKNWKWLGLFSPSSLFKKILFIYFLEGKGGKREGEKHQCAVASHVPWLGIEPTIFLFAGQCSIHWTTPARAFFTLFFKNVVSLYLYGSQPCQTQCPLKKKKRFYIFIFREGEGGRKRGREISMCGCLSSAPYWPPGLQPRHMPWLGIEPATLWFTGRQSIHWSTAARAPLFFLISIIYESVDAHNMFLFAYKKILKNIYQTVSWLYLLGF